MKKKRSALSEIMVSEVTAVITGTMVRYSYKCPVCPRRFGNKRVRIAANHLGLHMKKVHLFQPATVANWMAEQFPQRSTAVPWRRSNRLQRAQRRAA